MVFFFFFLAVYVIFDLAICEFFAVFAGYNIWMEEWIGNFLYVGNCCSSGGGGDSGGGNGGGGDSGGGSGGGGSSGGGCKWL